MIVVKTNEPSETLKLISEDYLIQSENYIFYSSIDEVYIDMTKEYITSNFQTKRIKNKLLLVSPLLILTNSDDVIDYLDSQFMFNKISSNEPEIFIKSGFLPINESIIADYVKNNIPSFVPSYTPKLTENQYYIFRLFKDLGYLIEINDNVFEPSDKLISSLIDTTYATQLIILKNNLTNDIMSNPKYNASIYEILKLINIHIFTAIEK